MFNKVSAALAELIQPVSTQVSTQAKTFQRFVPQKGPKDEKGETEPDDAGSESDSKGEAPPPNNVIPLRPRKELSKGVNLNLLSTLLTLKDSHKLLFGFGRKLYSRMKREQDRSKVRKGIVLDHKVE